MSDKKTEIINAAIRLLNREGVGVSTAKIAKEAGVSNGTLFNYFPTKQLLIDGVYLSVKTEMAKLVEGINLEAPLVDIVREYWRLYFAWALKNRAANDAIIMLVESGLASDAAKEKTKEIFAVNNMLIERGIASGDTIDMPPQYIGELFLAQINLAVASNLSKENSEKAFEIFWRGIRA